MSTVAPTGLATPGGLTVRVKRVGEMPIVAARVLLRGGARLEEIPGQALLTGRMLAEGTRRRSFERVVSEAEDRGMVLESFGTHEALGVAIEALTEDWELALEWLAELVFEPAFDRRRAAWLARQAAGELDSLLDQPENRTAQAFLEELYHPHPYARPLQGDRASLERLEAADIAAFHHRSLGWGGLVVVTGQIDPEAVERRVGDLFGDLAAADAPLPPVPPPPARGARRRQVRVGDAETGQAHLLAGHLTVPRRHDAHPALAVLAVILGAGAGLGGRLPERIREREGLAYQVDVALTAGAGLDAGRLAVYVGTSPATLSRAEELVREELRRLVEDGLAPGELDDARAYLLGREPFRRETACQWADLLAEAAFYDLESERPEWLAERLAALTKEEVEGVARRFIDPASLGVVTGAPPGRRGAPRAAATENCLAFERSA